MVSTEQPVEYEFPVSPAQARLLVLDRMHPGSAQYHVPVAFAVHGPLDVAALRSALGALVARHESLRTTFRVTGGDYRQVVVAESAVPLRIEHADDVPAATRAAAERPFDLARGPLLRCVVYPVEPDLHHVLIVVHHLVTDGWSLAIMLRELGVYYRAALGGVPADPPELPIQYPDYASWLRDRLTGGGYRDAVEYWRAHLDGAPDTAAIPTDLPRPAVQTPAGGVVAFALPAWTEDRLATLAASRGSTVYTVLLAAFTAFLSRITGRDDLVVGMPVSGRDHPDVQGLVGLLTNTIALRTDLSGAPSFAGLIDRVAAVLRDSAPYQEAPFSAVVDAVAPERQLSHDPVVQVVFSLDDEPELDLVGLTVRRLDLALPVAKFDLWLNIERGQGKLTGRFSYRTDLLRPETVRCWADAFRTLLAGLLADPDRPVDHVDLLGPEPERRIVRDWNRTGTAVPDRLVPDLIADRAAERPRAIALVAGDVVLTYRELLDRADALAGVLRSAGVGPEVPVGLCLPRGPEMAIAALAVLRAGGAYLPLDPEQPPVRLAAMLTDAAARLVLVTEDSADTVANSAVPVAVLADAATGFLVPPPESAPVIGPVRPPSPGHAAYLLFTSGSTGTPKGVVVEHGALRNLATAVRAEFPVTQDDRVLQYVSFGFDVAVSDLVFTWVVGAELHIAGASERLGDALYARLRDSRISYVFLPPSAAMSLPCPPDALPDLRLMAVGGEACPPELVRRWATPHRRVLDAYGPSEATVYASTADLTPDRPVVIGRPVPNGGAYVLDHRLRPVPVGVIGEIYLAGDHLARGYAGRPDMTAERFVADPFGPPGTRMYRTGDLGRYDVDGVLSYLGRIDTQVKLHGFRVELGEVETVLAGHPEVSVAVAAVSGSGASRRLVAYVIGVDGRSPDPGVLRNWAAERLPGYMVPNVVLAVDELPLSRAGKVDRSRLPEPPSTRPDLGLRYVPPGTPTERRLAEVWRQVLGLDRIGLRDNFFDLGGNSVRLLAVLTALRERGIGGDLTMVDLFRFPDIATLAARIDGAGAPADPEPVRRGETRRARLAAARTVRDDARGGTR